MFSSKKVQFYPVNCSFTTVHIYMEPRGDNFHLLTHLIYNVMLVITAGFFFILYDFALFRTIVSCRSYCIGPPSHWRAPNFSFSLMKIKIITSCYSQLSLVLSGKNKWWLCFVVFVQQGVMFTDKYVGIDWSYPSLTLMRINRECLAPKIKYPIRKMIKRRRNLALKK